MDQNRRMRRARTIRQRNWHLEQSIKRYMNWLRDLEAGRQVHYLNRRPGKACA